MAYKTLEGVLYPDGKIELPPDELPERPMRVMVTILGEAEEGVSDLGDYLTQLTDYEERLSRGEIHWS